MSHCQNGYRWAAGPASQEERQLQGEDGQILGKYGDKCLANKHLLAQDKCCEGTAYGRVGAVSRSNCKALHHCCITVRLQTL